MNKDRFFLHYYFRVAGVILVTAGIISAVLYMFFQFRIEMPVFAIASAYIEMKYFTIFSTNIAEEIILLSLLSGFFFLVFSRDKEGRIPDQDLRSKAFSNAVFYNTLFLGLSVIFLYGQAFLAVLALNTISLFILYLLFYRSGKAKEAKALLKKGQRSAQ